MIHIGLFEGIGGFSLAARWAGWKTYATCEIAEFPQKVLKHHFPDAYHHGDIKTLTYETINAKLSARFGSEWRNDEIILTGGFPCQPYSAAGKRLGKEDDRHLWPEMLRIIREVKPTWIVGENVLGLVNWSGGLVFEEVQADLEIEGYEVQPYVLPACAVNAPHRRDRVWFVAFNSNNTRRGAGLGQVSEADGEMPERNENAEFGDASSRYAANADQKLCQCGNSCGKNGWSIEAKRIESFGQPNDWAEFPTQSAVCSRNDGISYRLDDITFSKWRNESIKAYGNAIVPQVAFQIFNAINEYDVREKTLSEMSVQD